ncbi:MAG TPA: L,D-transpeptidase [Solirubrobacteraceae bacterium]|jgi:lipoprotein-anchoring transpeptidase ErfK/SrfK
MDTTIIPTIGPTLGSPRAAAGNLRRGHCLATALAALGLAGAAVGSRAAASPAHVPAITRLAVLMSPHAVHVEPEATSPQTKLLPARTPITGQRTTLPVTGSLTGADGVQWLQVMLPGRPNSSKGWIAQSGTRRILTEWHLVINLGARHVTVYREGHIVRTFRAVVGKPSTPTPQGQFFVEEAVHMSAGEPGGPFALALSARSNALQEFEGGPGQIAMHGRDNLGGTLGTAESHGCVRFATAAIVWLSTRISAGIPVTIKGG